MRSADRRRTGLHPPSFEHDSRWPVDPGATRSSDCSIESWRWKDDDNVILGRYLARSWRVALLHYDESAHLADLVAELAPNQHTVTRRVWRRTAGHARLTSFS